MTRSWESFYIGAVAISSAATELAENDTQGQRQREHIVIAVITMYNNNK